MKPQHSVNSTEIPPLLSGITTIDKYLAVLAAHEDWHRCIVDDCTFIDKPNKIARKTTHGYIQCQLITDNKAEGERFLEETEKIFADIVARFPGWLTPDPIIRYKPKQGMYYRQLRFTYDENEKFMQVIPEYLAIINADPSKLDFVFDKYAAAKAKCCKFEYTTSSASATKNKKASTFEYDYDTAISKFIASLASPDAKKTANHILKRHFEQFYRELFPEWITEDITDTIDYYWVENNVFGGRTRETYYYTMNSHGECAVNLTELAGIYYQRLCSECGIQPSDTFLRMFYPILYNEIELLKLKFGVFSGTSTESEKIIQNFQEKIWKNGFNDVTLEQLDNIINEIQNGKLQIETENARRVARNYNRPRSSRNADAAAVICGREGRTYPQISFGDKDYFKESERSERYQQLIEQWAKSEGCWVDDLASFDTDYVLIGEGSEAKVYDVKTENSHSVFKVIGLNMCAGLVQRLIERIFLHNCLFGDSTHIDIIGFGRSKNGYFKLILEQPYIEGRRVRIKRINKFILKKYPDLTQINLIEFRNNDFIIRDLHNKNVLKDHYGNFYVIDCFLAFNDSKADCLGRYSDHFKYEGNPIPFIDNIPELEDIIYKANVLIEQHRYKGYGRTAEEAIVYQYWKGIKREANQRKRELRGLLKSPLFKNEILLIKQKYKPTKNR